MLLKTFSNIQAYKNQRKYEFFCCFSFRTVSKEDLLYQLNSLDPTKATQKYDIPTNIIKKNYDIFSEFRFANFNEIIRTSRFPEQLKYTDVKPVLKRLVMIKEIIDQQYSF